MGTGVMTSSRGPPKVVGHHRHKHGLKKVYYKIVYNNC